MGAWNETFKQSTNFVNQHLYVKYQIKVSSHQYLKYFLSICDIICCLVETELMKWYEV